MKTTALTTKTTTKEDLGLKRLGILPQRKAGSTPFLTPPDGEFKKLTSTVLQARLRLFQASQRPAELHGEWFETSYGKCRIEGRLGQRHADLLSSILISTEKYRLTNDGGVEVLIDPYVIRKGMSDSHQYSYSQFKLLLKDLATALITLDSPTIKTTGHLIDYYDEEKLPRFNPLTQGDRSPFVIKIGKVLAKLISEDYPLFYNPEPLTRLKYGISQAVARFILTHSSEPNGGWKIDETIRHVTGVIRSDQLRKHRERIRADQAILATLGIVLDDDRLHLGPRTATDLTWEEKDWKVPVIPCETIETNPQPTLF